MNKETLINNKITYLDDLIEISKKNIGRKKALYNILKFFTLGFGVAILFSAPLTGLAAAPIAAIFHMLGTSSEEKTKNLIAIIEKEKEHLEATRTKNLNGSKELNSKRKKKIKSLNKTKSIINSQKRKMGFASFLCGATTLIGSAITLSTPLGGIFALVGLVGLKTNLNSVINKRKRVDTLDARINNLQNDLDIINVSKNSKTIKQRKDINMKPGQTTQNAKAKVKNKSYIPKQVHDDSIDKDETIINDYIYGLENQRIKEHPKRKIKY